MPEYCVSWYWVDSLNKCVIPEKEKPICRVKIDWV
jgi:hypothetical protein